MNFRVIFAYSESFSNENSEIIDTKHSVRRFTLGDVRMSVTARRVLSVFVLPL